MTPSSLFAMRWKASSISLNGKVCGHRGGVDAVVFEQAEEALEAEAAAGTERGDDVLLGHADAPVVPRYLDELALAVVADVRDGAAGFRDADAVLERLVRPEGFDGDVDALAVFVSYLLRPSTIVHRTVSV